jgi:hypothetical protein
MGCQRAIAEKIIARKADYLRINTSFLSVLK